VKARLLNARQQIRSYAVLYVIVIRPSVGLTSCQRYNKSYDRPRINVQLVRSDSKNCKGTKTERCYQILRQQSGFRRPRILRPLYDVHPRSMSNISTLRKTQEARAAASQAGTSCANWNKKRRSQSVTDRKSPERYP